MCRPTEFVLFYLLKIKDILEFVTTYNHFISFRSSEPDYPPNACRVHGSLNVNKVAGNFHITAGKSLSVPHGHIHISAFMTDRDYNFTHRINRFSFGGPSPGIVHPLEGDEKIADNSKSAFYHEVLETSYDNMTFHIFNGFFFQI